MFLRIERSSGIPVTRQILDQIRARCASGSLRPGDRLPSVRELARELTVNQNTILHVYERLEVEGLIERRHGAGTFVADRAPGGVLSRQRERIRHEIETLVRHARSLGVAADRLCDWVEESYVRQGEIEEEGVSRNDREDD